MGDYQAAVTVRCRLCGHPLEVEYDLVSTEPDGEHGFTLELRPTAAAQELMLEHELTHPDADL